MVVLHSMSVFLFVNNNDNNNNNGPLKLGRRQIKKCNSNKSIFIVITLHHMKDFKADRYLLCTVQQKSIY